jgi:hypothetical protein
MAIMKTTAKINPITGDSVNNSSFPGSTGSKREERKNAAGTLTRRQNNAINKGVNPETGKIQYKDIPTKGEMRREERQKIRENKKDSPKSAAPLKGKVIKNSKVKIVKGGGPAKPPPMRKRDQSCQKPR